MANPVVHFELIGPDPQVLRGFYAELFGWQYDTSRPVVAQVSVPDDYGFIAPDPEAGGVAGGIGGGVGYESRALFYVGVPDVAEALAGAERLGGTRVLGPVRAPTGLVVGRFLDPAGNLVGVAAPA